MIVIKFSILDWNTYDWNIFQCLYKSDHMMFQPTNLQLNLSLFISSFYIQPTYVLVRLSYLERKVCLVSCSFHVTKYATTPTNYVSSLHLKSKRKISFELFISFKKNPVVHLPAAQKDIHNLVNFVFTFFDCIFQHGSYPVPKNNDR